MTKKQFSKLVADSKEWLERYKAKGNAIAYWECPCCNNKNETPKPTRALVRPGGKGWDSSKICIHCGAVSFVFVSLKGISNVISQMTQPIITQYKNKTKQCQEK